MRNQALSRPFVLGGVVVALCSYEIAALTSGRLPTISALCRRHRWAEAALLAALLVHLHHEEVVIRRELLRLRRDPARSPG